MKNKYTPIIFASLFSLYMAAAAAGKNGGFEIDANINDVQTFRIGKNLVRYIHYNRLEMPNFVFELIKTPKYVLLNKLNVNAVTIDVEGKPKKLDLYNQTKVELRKLKPNDGKLDFELEYISGERGGGYYLVSCSIGVAADKLETPVCQLLKTELSN